MTAQIVVVQSQMLPPAMVMQTVPALVVLQLVVQSSLLLLLVLERVALHVQMVLLAAGRCTPTSLCCRSWCPAWPLYASSLSSVHG